MKSVYLALIVVGIYTIGIQTGYGQRVYADTQQPDDTFLLSSVTNENFAVDSDLTNFSILQVNVGLLGSIGTATQNLQFTGAIKPEVTAPLMIRFKYSGAVLGLSNVFGVQRTNGGLNQTRGDNYAGSTLVGLLALDAEEDSGEVTVPVPATNEITDGIRLRLSSILGVGPSANLYYAFFITPPNMESNVVSVCEDEPALLSISNFQSGYTYRIYDALTGGNLLYSGTENVLSLPASGLTAGTYYLEAVEGGTEFTSSRTPFDIVIYPKPRYPDIELNVNQN